MLIHWIWFATRALGDHRKLSRLSHFSDVESLYFAGKTDYAACTQISEEGMGSLLDKDLTESEKILTECTNAGIHILTFQDAAYPNRLKNIPDPTMVLYYKGQLPDVDSEPVIGVVGTRKASPYGLQVAKRMGYQIAACGGIVVSGMAFGIDSMAMAGALTRGMPVSGVLGCGADGVYPPSTRCLFADTERYGCILTEFPPGTPPLGRNFPRRNRIISGLSCGVLVVEAPEKSGALITARAAADQGRDVFVVPSNIDVDSGVGSNALLRDGAIAVTAGWEILSEYHYQFPDKIRREGEKTKLTVYPDEVERATAQVAQKRKKPEKSPAVQEKFTKKVIDNRQNEPYSDFTKIEASLTADERTIVELLRQGEAVVDDVIAASGLSAGRVLASLTLLEVKGLVRRLPGRMVVFTGGKS